MLYINNKKFKVLHSYYFPFDRDLIKSDCLGKSGVYLVLNHINLKFYIGSAVSTSPKHNRLYIRFLNHFFHTHKVSSPILSRAFKKYGQSNFSYHIISFESVGKTRGSETLFIQKLKPAYNILKIAGTSLGFKHSDETKLKMSLNYSEERRNFIKNLNLNKSLSPSTREKLSLAGKKRFNMLNSTEQDKIREKMRKDKRFDFSKEVQVYNADSLILMGEHKSLKAA